MPLSNLLYLCRTEVEELTRTKPLAIIPIGATENYGPHLPLGTDSIVAEWLALRVAERHGGMVAPLMPVGCSQLFQDFPGTLSISEPTVYAILQGLGQSLHSSGFRHLLIINGHAGNSSAISKYLAEEGRTLFQTALQIDVWRLAESLGQDLFAGVVGAFGHAGPCATSLMLAIAPELVQLEITGSYPPVRPRWLPGVYAPGTFRSIYPEGYVGDIGRSSAEKGKELINRMLNYILGILSQAATQRDRPGPAG